MRLFLSAVLSLCALSGPAVAGGTAEMRAVLSRAGYGPLSAQLAQVTRESSVARFDTPEQLAEHKAALEAELCAGVTRDLLIERALLELEDTAFGVPVGVAVANLKAQAIIGLGALAGVGATDDCQYSVCRPLFHEIYALCGQTPDYTGYPILQDWCEDTHGSSFQEGTGTRACLDDYRSDMQLDIGAELWDFYCCQEDAGGCTSQAENGGWSCAEWVDCLETSFNQDPTCITNFCAAVNAIIDDYDTLFLTCCEAVPAARIVPASYNVAREPSPLDEIELPAAWERELELFEFDREWIERQLREIDRRHAEITAAMRQGEDLGLIVDRYYDFDEMQAIVDRVPLDDRIFYLGSDGELYPNPDYWLAVMRRTAALHHTAATLKQERDDAAPLVARAAGDCTPTCTYSASSGNYTVVKPAGCCGNGAPEVTFTIHGSTIFYKDCLSGSELDFLSDLTSSEYRCGDGSNPSACFQAALNDFWAELPDCECDWAVVVAECLCTFYSLHNPPTTIWQWSKAYCDSKYPDPGYPHSCCGVLSNANDAMCDCVGPAFDALEQAVAECCLADP